MAKFIVSRIEKWTVLFSLLLFWAAACDADISPVPIPLNIGVIEKTTGYKGQWNDKEEIYKLTIPHIDIKVLLSGMPVASSQALDSWVIFKKIENQTVLLGNLMLLQDQVNPVLGVALDNQLQVRQLRSPFLWDSPRILFMTIEGRGSEEQLGKALSRVFAKIEATQNGGGDFPLGNIDAVTATFDKSVLQRGLGLTGSLKEGIYQISLNQQIKPSQDRLTRALLGNTWVAFAGSSEDAIASGTVALRVSDLQAILLILRKAQFYILGIDESVLHDDEKIVLVPFLGIDTIHHLVGALNQIFSIIEGKSKSMVSIESMGSSIGSAGSTVSIGSIPVMPITQTSSIESIGFYHKSLMSVTPIISIKPVMSKLSEREEERLRIFSELTRFSWLEGIKEKYRFTRSLPGLPALTSVVYPSHRLGSILPSARNILARLSVELTQFGYFNTNSEVFSKWFESLFKKHDRVMVAGGEVDLSMEHLPVILLASSDDKGYFYHQLHTTLHTKLVNKLDNKVTNRLTNRLGVVHVVHRVVVQRRVMKPISVIKRVAILAERKSIKKFNKQRVKYSSFVSDEGVVDPVPMGFYPFDEEPS